MNDKKTVYFKILREHGVKGVIALLVLTIGGLYFLKPNSQESVIQSQSLVEDQQSEESTEKKQEKIIYVDVKGEVVDPGVYQVESQMRVTDIVDLAGGFTKSADKNQVNLAQKVEDQMVVVIPKIGEEVSALGIVSQSPKKETATKINLNTATVEELEELNGIGPSKAQAIITHRETNGSFQAIDELKNVKGVGEKTFDSLRESITID